MTQASPPIRLAIYDMDKTITRRPTYGGFLLHMAMARAPWRLLLSPLMLIGLAAYGLRLWDRSRLKTFNQRLFVGRPRQTDPAFLHAVESFADKVMADNLHADAAARIAHDRAEGYRLVMATASYAIYVLPIARRLGFDHVIATDLRLGGAGEWLAEIIEGNCYGKVKIDKLRRWLADEGLDRGALHVRAYSDHVSDAPLLEFADEAFAVNPHSPLRTEAARRGWQVFDWT